MLARAPQSQDYTSEYPYTSIERLQIPPITFKFPKEPIDYSLSLIFSKYEEQKKYNKPLYQEPFRIIVFGGDLELFGAIQIICDLFEKKNQENFFKLYDYRVYIVPTKPFPLANYIALKDVWYSKHLYIPFTRDLLIPKFDYMDQRELLKIVQQNFSAKSSPNTDPLAQNQQPQFMQQNQNQNQGNYDSLASYLTTPFKFLMNCLYSYIREAEMCFPVQLYKAECSFYGQPARQQQEPPNLSQEKRSFYQETVYFCQYLEIGASVEFELQKLQQQLQGKKNTEHMTLYDAIDKNVMKFTSLDLSLTTQLMDFNDMLGEPEETKGKIFNIKINNVYKELFLGNIPTPTDRCIELSFITEANYQLLVMSLQDKIQFRHFSRKQPPWTLFRGSSPRALDALSLSG